MRDTFRAYYRPTDAEMTKIWQDGIIVLDANVLLNFFRYTASTREAFLEVLSRLEGKLWLPHQAGLEFHRNRLIVINGTSQVFGEVTSALEKAQKTVESAADAYRHHPSFSRVDFLSALDQLIKNLIESIKTQKDAHQKSVFADGEAESTFGRISSLFDERVGEAFTKAELEAIEKDGKERYANKVPPGYKDSGKEDNPYGDLIIWREMLKWGEANKRPMIFVTDDNKEDWWWRENGKTQGPRVELIQEYWAVSEQRIHFYEPFQFLERAQSFTSSSISSETLKEVDEVSRAKNRERRILLQHQQQLFKERDMLRERRHYDGRTDSSQHEVDAISSELKLLEQESSKLQAKKELLEAEDESWAKILADGEFDFIETEKFLTHREAVSDLEMLLAENADLQSELRERIYYLTRQSRLEMDTLHRELQRNQEELFFIQDALDGLGND